VDLAELIAAVKVFWQTTRIGVTITLNEDVPSCVFQAIKYKSTASTPPICNPSGIFIVINTLRPLSIEPAVSNTAPLSSATLHLETQMLPDFELVCTDYQQLQVLAALKVFG
jgi:hypothetical protein